MKTFSLEKEGKERKERTERVTREEKSENSFQGRKDDERSCEKF